MSAAKRKTSDRPELNIIRVSRNEDFVRLLVKRINEIQVGVDVPELKRGLHRKLADAGFSKRQRERIIALCSGEVARWTISKSK